MLSYQSGKKVRASVRPVATRKVCSTGLDPSCNCARAAYKTSVECVAASRNNCPAAVSDTGCERTTSSAPTHCSKALMRRPNAGCVTKRFSAAREKLRVRASSMKSSSQIRCTLLSLFYPDFLQLHHIAQHDQHVSNINAAHTAPATCASEAHPAAHRSPGDR